MGELEPRLGEGKFELFRIVEETLRDCAIGRVFLQCQVGCEHDRRVTLIRIMRIGNERSGVFVSRNPLGRTRRAFCLLPFEVEQVGQILMGELRRA